MNVVNFPAPAIPRPEIAAGAAEQAADFRSRDLVAHDIRQHEAARAHYAQAVAWTAAAEESNLPPAQIEDARKAVVEAFEEMNWRGRCLVVSMPTDLRGLVDLTMYLEKHFSILPPEVGGKSLALELLKTMRLSLRAVAKYGKHRRDTEEGAL
ncbi:hypothetical protein KMZ68_13775 [Bradyrhizobium sediminis]|uniref:Uncharacterized protein n=1 Tax=Bradyrhizobium sediminis TaxID=2840469 RepID=A0A975NJ47_9BRAD|nr:hypothetical protein [Bradyrhizobium sediminis]QWG16113.1 hypothetical protein KMZ68_13775 [Bradyrhizobium sediminis]